MTDNAQRTQTQSFMNEFVDLIDAVAADGIPSTTDLLTEPFIRYRQNLIIYRHEPLVRDFRVTLFGTEVVESYGEDWIDKFLSEVGSEKGYETIYRVNLEIMEGSKRVADSGELKRHFNNFSCWHEIKMPLRRRGIVSEVLVFMCFS